VDEAKVTEVDQPACDTRQTIAAPTSASGHYRTRRDDHRYALGAQRSTVILVVTAIAGE
jgi:hypothetical protein